MSENLRFDHVLTNLSSVYAKNREFIGPMAMPFRPVVGWTPPAPSYRRWQRLSRIGSAMHDRFARYVPTIDDCECVGLYERKTWPWLVRLYVKVNESAPKPILDPDWKAPVMTYSWSWFKSQDDMTDN